MRSLDLFARGSFICSPLRSGRKKKEVVGGKLGRRRALLLVGVEPNWQKRKRYDEGEQYRRADVHDATSATRGGICKSVALFKFHCLSNFGCSYVRMAEPVAHRHF